MKLRQIDNPPNPYDFIHAEWLEPPPLAKLTVYEEQARSILSTNNSPDIPFRYSVNPYRGCQHACAYCYARPCHEYLGMGAGTDFDTKLVVKVNAPGLLRNALSRKSWTRETIEFSGITDCYQPLEASYALTRQCLEVCRDFCNPIGLITKAYLVVRDAKLLADLDRLAGAHVCISIPFADAKVAAALEPQVSPPARRFEAVRCLAEAGVPVSVMVAPIIPGLSDQHIPEILQRAAEAGACSAWYTLLRLPGSVESVFVSRLKNALPLRAEAILHRLREMRGGALDEGKFHKRMTGNGPYWNAVVSLFELWKKRTGLDRRPRTAPDRTVHFKSAATSCDSSPSESEFVRGCSPGLFAPHSSSDQKERQLSLFE